MPYSPDAGGKSSFWGNGLLIQLAKASGDASARGENFILHNPEPPLQITLHVLDSGSPGI